MNKNYDYIVINSSTQKFECKHCGGSQPMSLPCSIEMLSVMGKQFKKEHKDCKEKK